MKLQNELNYIINRFKKITNLQEYAIRLKESGEYRDFETRLAWDCLRATVPNDVICGWYDKYNCNDAHITSVIKRALQEVYQS